MVVIVVDQMRGDYVDKFRGQRTGRSKRLVEEGAWFHEAAYPYSAMETCVGHATISTGAFPAIHGMIANAWWDRDQQKMVACTSDPNAIGVSWQKRCMHALPNNSTGCAGFFGWTWSFVLSSPQREFL